MRFRDKLCLCCTPCIIRLVLAATFLWAGYGKIFTSPEYTPAQAATLANLGVEHVQNQAIMGSNRPEEAAPAADDPPRVVDSNVNADLDDLEDMAAGAIFMLAQNSLADKPAEPEASSPDDTSPNKPNPDANAPAAAPPMAHHYTAADFSGPITARGHRQVALLVYHATHREDGAASLLPDMFSKNPWPSLLGQAVGYTEFLAGVLLLIGLLTRLSGLALVGVMAGAIWLTAIGPIVFPAAGVSAGSFLGFLPNLAYTGAEAGASFNAWSSLLWQLALLTMGLAAFISGPGILSLDGLFFGKKRKKPTTEIQEANTD